MTLAFDFYFSFRSPYSYLATPQVEDLIARYDVLPRMRFVLPIAVRIPGFFKAVNPLWPPYVLRDTFRIAQMHDIPYRWPRPDPIVMDIATGAVAAEQPYIYRVTRLAVAAECAGKGFLFARHAAHAIWSGEVDNWHEGNAGHWGVPLFVFNDEPFFGQDRLDHLIWRMHQLGLRERHPIARI